MLQTHRQPSPLSSANALFPSLYPLPSYHSLNFPFRAPNRCSSSTSYAHKEWNALLADESITAAGTPPQGGPVELFPTASPIFATSDEPTPLQTATSVLLTGAITVFLFRSIHRRARLVIEKKLRSSDDGNKPLVEEAMASLKSVSPSPGSAKARPSPAQAFLGAIAAGVIALILYKFTITIESALNRQTISDSYSVRQITITIRTIINGLCYLATFVFGVNSVGLFLYSGQLAFKSFMEGPSDESQAPSNPPSPPDDVINSGITSVTEDQSSEDTIVDN